MEQISHVNSSICFNSNQQLNLNHQLNIMDDSMETFFGKLLSECDQKCKNCTALKSHVKFLERKVIILEDIVQTSQTIAEINGTLLHQSTNQSIDYRAVLDRCSDVAVQTEFENDQIEYDSECEVPESFMLINSDGIIEAPDSIISNNTENQISGSTGSVNPWHGVASIMLK